MNLEKRNTKIELYGRGFELLTAALAEIPKEAWKFKPSPDAWSIHEIIIHLADSETNAAIRARKLAVEPGGLLMNYDQDVWAQELNYHNQDTEDALALVQFARKTTYNLLKSLPEAVFNHTVRHPEFLDPYSFDTWLDIYSRHIPGHIEQVKNNHAIWRDRK